MNELATAPASVQLRLANARARAKPFPRRAGALTGATDS